MHFQVEIEPLLLSPVCEECIGEIATLSPYDWGRQGHESCMYKI